MQEDLALKKPVAHLAQAAKPFRHLRPAPGVPAYLRFTPQT